jgi:hypothetical protein
MRNATTRGYQGLARTHTATRKRAWVGPLLTFMLIEDGAESRGFDRDDQTLDPTGGAAHRASITGVTPHGCASVSK